MLDDMYVFEIDLCWSRLLIFCMLDFASPGVLGGSRSPVAWGINTLFTLVCLL